MAYVLPVGLGVVAAVFLLIVVGEVFYLFYWRKRPLAYPRGNNVTVAPVNEGEGVREGSEVVIDVTCAEYQIAALHQDLVEKLFPALGMSSSTESAHNLMGPTRMLFTITEETKEELEGLDLGPRRRSRRSSRSKSMSDISLSPIGPLSPLSSSFATPLSSPDQDQFITPYGTPTYSPLVTLPRSLSTSPVVLHTSSRIMYDHSNCSPPAGPPSPTRPTFPFLSRTSSPTKSSDGTQQETFEWGSPNGSILSPNNALFYSPPRKPFMFATPIHSKQVDNSSLVRSPLRACTYVYENGTFSPSSPSSPQFFHPLLLTQTEHSCNGIQDHNHSSSCSPASSSSSTSASLTPLFHHCTPPSDTVVSSSIPASSSCRPSSKRSSSTLFATSLSRPSQSPSLTEDAAPSKYFLGTGFSPPSESTTTISSGWGE